MKDFEDKTIQQMIGELTSGDEGRAEAAVHRLAACGEEVVAMLKELYGQPDADIRWWALRALSEIPCETSKAVMIGGLGDEDSGVRYCAALGLRQQPTAQAISSLIGQLDSPDKLLTRLACDALIHIGEEAVPTLLAVLEKGTQEVRVEAVRALAHIGDKRSIPQLFEVLEEDSAMLEYWANEGLEKMGVGMLFVKP
jgi:HEAT repeat protein